MFQVKADDGLLFPRLQPEITGNPTVVFIDAPVAASPVVELAGPHAQPVDESSGADLGFFRPAPDEIHHQVPHIVWHPHLGQSSPRLFFKAMCSAINSASGSREVAGIPQPSPNTECRYDLALREESHQPFRVLSGRCQQPGKGRQGGKLANRPSPEKHAFPGSAGSPVFRPDALCPVVGSDRSEPETAGAIPRAGPGRTCTQY